MKNDLLPQGCVHGRFQPPHLDHLKYIRAALAEVEHLIIGIAQPDAPYLDKCEDDPHRAQKADNPLTYVERCIALERMLTGVGISRDKFSFSRFPIDRPNELAEIIPASVICFTTIRDDWNRKKIAILEQHGYVVKVLWENLEQGISGTEIRQQIRSSDAKWEKDVHPAVAGYLNSEHLVDRIKLG